MPPIVGIDASRYPGEVRTGTETYSRELLDALASLDDLPFALRSYVNQADRASCEMLSRLGEVRRIPFPRLWTHGRLSFEMISNRPDLLFVPSHVIPLIHPRSVVTVHDLGYLHEPDAHPTAQRRMLDLTTRWNARAAAHVIAISNTPKADLSKSYRVASAKISVIHHGVGDHFRPSSDDQQGRVRAEYGLPARFVLAVGTIQPRKNLGRLAQAVATLRETDPELALVVAGKRGWLSDKVIHQIETALPTEGFRELGYVPHRDLPALYSAATVTAMVSTYEGFGLPALEAMRCGAPLVVSDAPALIEVAGDTALVASRNSVRDIAEQIRRVIEDPAVAGKLRVDGIVWAARFTWDRTAQETAALLERVLHEQ